jgi:hypothetical protein
VNTLFRVANAFGARSASVVPLQLIRDQAFRQIRHSVPAAHAHSHPEYHPNTDKFFEVSGLFPIGKRKSGNGTKPMVQSGAATVP